MSSVASTSPSDIAVRARGLVGLAAILLLVNAATISRAATFTVGAGDCSSPLISGALLLSALNGPGPDLIRIASNQSYTSQHIVISNQSVSLVGGYTDCSDTTAGGQTTLSGAGGSTDPVIEISGTTNGTRTVELVGLQITGGELGGVTISGSNIVSIQRSIISGNSAPNGGGISIDGTDGAILTVDFDASVIDNNATAPSGSGGGIYCNGATLLLEGLVATNHAWFGGGISTIGCTVNDFAGGFLRGVAQNTAAFGAGIAAFNGSDINLIGGTDHPATVSGNIASADGGGLYISNSTVTAKDSWITGNRAQQGGAVAADTGGTFVMHRTYGPTCHDPIRCSKVTGNTATLNIGGAFYASAGGSIEVRQTYIEGNTATFGAAAFAEGSSGGTKSRLFLEGDAVGSNTGEYMLYVSDGAEFTASYVTSASNIPPTGLSSVAFYGNGSATDIARIYSSVISDSVVYGGGTNGASHSFDCVVSPNLFGLPSSGTIMLEADPRLHNPAGRDYSPTASSPAIDRCDNFHPATDADLHNNPRGIDQPWAANFIGAYDVGALETDIMFGNGFETGSTAAWSSHSP